LISFAEAMKKGTLYLIPTTLGDTPPEAVMPAAIKDVINAVDEFIVEDERSARRYLKKAGITRPLDTLVLHTLNKHTEPEEVAGYLGAIAKGMNVGVLSEAGCPGIADPGAEVVKIAHRKGIKVVPLVGPSSILLALMASGFSGQSFTFHGYLPKERGERIRKLKDLERTAQQKDQTQLFIETPFRNQHLLEDILSTCSPATPLCIACDITLPSELIRTQSIADWKNQVPDINKRPAIFLIYR
jgi:16S rRNA (cytidine1402-2'-O)-methyltransferase